MTDKVALSAFWWFSLFLSVAYCLAAWWLPADLVSLVVDSMLAVISFAVVVVFVPGVWRLQVGGVTDGRMLIRLGIIASWTCSGVLSLHRILAQEFHLFGVLDPETAHPARGFITVLFMLAAMLHITAIGAIEKQTPLFNLLVVGVALGVGFLCSVVVYLARHSFA